MSDIGINLSLNTGSAASNVKALSGAFDSLGEAIRKALEAGNAGDAKTYGELALKLRQQMATEAKVAGGHVEAQSPAMRTVHGVTTFLNRGAGYISSAGGGNVAGAALGAAGDSGGLLASMKGLPGGLMGGAVIGGLAALGAGANKLVEQFENVMKPSMDLAATFGKLGTDSKKNSVAISDAFNRSASQAIKFGYSMEEGIQLATDLGRRGVSEKYVDAAEAKVLKYQRATGADRGTLTDAEALSKRYGAGDALGLAMGGVEQSKMEPGQYQEYLSATLRIFEEGLSRGVVRGFGEIARTQNAFAAIGTTWKGELGAQRYQQMNSTVTDAVGLKSDYDVISYRAAQNLVKRAQKGELNTYVGHNKDTLRGPDLDAEYSKYDPGDRNSIGRLLNMGLTPSLLQEQMAIIKNEITNGTDSEMIKAVEGQFNVNTQAATDIVKAFTAGDFATALSYTKDPGSKVGASPEQTLLSEVQIIRKNLANAGENLLPGKQWLISQLVQMTNLLGGSKALGYERNQIQTTLNQISGQDSYSERQRVFAVLSKAADDKDQPDKNKNMIGDWREAGQELTAFMQSLSPSAQVKLATNTKLFKGTFADLQEPKDVMDHKADVEKKLSAISKYDDPGKDWAKGIGLGPEMEAELERGGQHALALYGSIKGNFGNNVSEFNRSAQKARLLEAIKAALPGYTKEGGFKEEDLDAIQEAYLQAYAPMKSEKELTANANNKSGNQAQIEGFLGPSGGEIRTWAGLKGGASEKNEKLVNTAYNIMSSNADLLDMTKYGDLLKQAKGKTGDGGQVVTEYEMLVVLKNLVADLSSSIKGGIEASLPDDVLQALKKINTLSLTVVQGN